MSKDKLTAVKYYDTVLKAEIDMEILKANNIECIYNDDAMVGVFPIFNDKERGIELMVFEKDLERAKKILDEYHSADSPVELSEEN